VKVGAIVTIEFVQEITCVVPVPANIEGGVVAVPTVNTPVDIQPFVAVMITE